MNPNLPTITIRREGTFQVPGLTLARQCGREGQKDFRFELQIVVQRLDESGFVCDNFEVPKMMERSFGDPLQLWEGSCEDFAGAGVVLAHQMCEGRALEISFEVSPISEAGVTVEWTEGQELPNFGPKKVGRARTSGPPSLVKYQKEFEFQHMPFESGDEIARRMRVMRDKFNPLFRERELTERR
ncbi:MAG: hypothetical protein CMJ75_18720 [Planctomycetaceae bacterium]|nr:hypothetical protein [Planctomycetaceae bacterium]